MSTQGFRNGLRALGCILTIAATPPAVASGLEFTPHDMQRWRQHSFSGMTEYGLTKINDRYAMHANCSASASGLFFEGKIDLRKTPILEWSWRVDAAFPASINETARAGDDYPARVYVVKDGGIMRWRTRAMNYVWASAMPQGSDWPNAYAPQARMVALRSGPPDTPGEWKTERRNVRDDFRRFHGMEVDSIDAVALMTDCDDLGTTAEAWYGTLRFLPAE
jgi:hypothetical protein